MTYYHLGPVPAEEQKADPMRRGYYTKAMRECTRHIKLLREAFPEREGVHYRVIENAGDFGDYLDVIVAFDPRVAGAADYAARVQRDAPRRWNGKA